MIQFLSIFKSQIRSKLLRLYFTSPQARFYIRQLKEKLGVSIGNLHRELKYLESQGILSSAKEGNLKYYSLNKSYPLYKELKSIVHKTIGLEGSIKEQLKKIKNIDQAFIFGSYAKGKEAAISDIDLFIIGQPDENELIVKINKLERELDREINYHIYSQKDLNKEKKGGNSFTKTVLSEKKIMLIGGKNDLSKSSKAKAT
ncbi:nucleotidyltransferase domain-containing protein [Patescibacteria group bacterium]|nr:nucleotidyltransferase domain-containing protein [Patescibacteria group bacterium]